MNMNGDFDNNNDMTEQTDFGSQFAGEFEDDLLETQGFDDSEFDELDSEESESEAEYKETLLDKFRYSPLWMKILIIAGGVILLLLLLFGCAYIATGGFQNKDDAGIVYEDATENSLYRDSVAYLLENPNIDEITASQVGQAVVEKYRELIALDGPITDENIKAVRDYFRTLLESLLGGIDGITAEDLDKLADGLMDILLSYLDDSKEIITENTIVVTNNGTSGTNGLDGKMLIKTVNGMADNEKEILADSLGISLDELKQMIEELSKGNTITLMELLNNMTDEEKEKLSELLGISLDELYAYIDAINASIDGLNSDVDDINKRLDNMESNMNDNYESTIDDMNTNVENLNQEITNLTNKYEKLEQSFNTDVKNLQELIKKTQTDLTNLIDGNTDDIESLRESLITTKNSLVKLIEETNGETTEYINNLVEQLNETINFLENKTAEDLENQKNELMEILNNTRDVLNQTINNNFQELTDMIKNQYEWSVDEDGTTVLTITTP